MNSTAFSTPSAVLAFGAQRVDAGKAHAEEHRIVAAR